MTTPGINTNQYEFKLIGNPTANAARIKAMAGDGPLLVAKDHALPLMLPKAFDDTAHAPQVKIDSTDLMALLGPHLFYDAEVAAGGMHFITKAAFWAALLKTMLETGNAWPTFDGPRAEAMPKAAAVLAKIIGDVPIDKRIMTINDTARPFGTVKMRQTQHRLGRTRHVVQIRRPKPRVRGREPCFYAPACCDRFARHSYPPHNPPSCPRIRGTSNQEGGPQI
jgi:hypothetical protein